MKVEAFYTPRDWDDVQRAARAAEQAGFDSFATPEIHNDPFVTAALALHATDRIGVRTAIALAFPRSPMLTATSAWELQHNSGGRFGLGLGSQVKGHNERRFSVPWSAPAPRMAEYVRALRATWACWQGAGPLDFRGEHYQLTLMTPEFTPEPLSGDPPRVSIAAVGPGMLRTAGRVADGVRLHGFCTRRYLCEVVGPQLKRGLDEAGRSRHDFEVCGGGFIATGPTDEEVARMIEWVRYRVAFYGSTPTYRPVLELHGWQELGAELHQLTRQGRWKEMPSRVPDELVHAFAAVGRWDELPRVVGERFGGISDCVELALMPGVDLAPLGEVLQDVRAVEGGQASA